jgi:hypothetical protein
VTRFGCRCWKALPLAALVALTLACGKKGPPLAPLRIVPARIEDLALTKTGDEVRARLTVPAANDDKSQPADVAAVELYAISGKPEDPFGQSLSGPDFLKYADLVGRVAIEPPPDPDAPPLPEGAPPPPPDPRPAQGEIVTLAETIDAADRQPFVHPKKKAAAAVEASEAVVVRPLGPPPLEDVFARTYVAVGVNRRGQKGPPSNRVAVPLLEPPAPPPAFIVEHNANAAILSWGAPAGARLRVQRPAEPTELASRPLVQSITPTTYNVYVVTRSGEGETVSSTPVNPAPVEVVSIGDPTARIGEERCYQVRALQVYGSARLESAPTPTVCRVLTDTFPPAAPKNLAAVGSEGGVSLIWEPNAEADLAGYLVLRGEVRADGSEPALAPLMTEPLKETTYRDATPTPGVRYVYAVVAVDGASPRNQSPESNRVEESAR